MHKSLRTLARKRAIEMSAVNGRAELWLPAQRTSSDSPVEWRERTTTWHTSGAGAVVTERRNRRDQET